MRGISNTLGLLLVAGIALYVLVTYFDNFDPLAGWHPLDGVKATVQDYSNRFNGVEFGGPLSSGFDPAPGVAPGVGGGWAGGGGDAF